MRKIHQIIVKKNLSEHPLKDEKKRKIGLMSLALENRFSDNKITMDNLAALGKTRSPTKR